MFQDFKDYFSEGWHHLIQLSALDHQLFLLILIIPYLFKDFKKLFWLISAFTIGHCFTLALVVFKIITPNTIWIELAIPITIILNACLHLFKILKPNSKVLKYSQWEYLIIVLFGLIHGMGYANGLQFELATDQNLLFCLFSFNLGLEFAQILILSLMLPIKELIYRSSKKAANIFIIALCIVGILLALKMFIERI